MTTTDTPALTALLLARCFEMRLALIRGAKNAMAGNGVDSLREAIWRDDQCIAKIEQMTGMKIAVDAAQEERDALTLPKQDEKEVGR